MPSSVYDIVTDISPSLTEVLPVSVDVCHKDSSCVSLFKVIGD